MRIRSATWPLRFDSILFGAGLISLAVLASAPLPCRAQAKTTPDSADHPTLWIQVVDQFDRPISEADVYSCAHWRCAGDPEGSSHTRTNKKGLARLQHPGARKRLLIKGVHKPGYDIRLGSVRNNQVQLNGTNRRSVQMRDPIWGDLSVGYSSKVDPYSLPSTSPVFVVKGYALGRTPCLEEGYAGIGHDGRAEKNWNIDDQAHYYLLGDDDSLLREGTAEHHDLKITINRSRYPWSGLFNSLLASYEVAFEFRDGGALLVEPGHYVHMAPAGRYRRRLSLSFRGGEVTRVHQKYLFAKMDDRYGVFELHISPSRSMKFAYRLSREEGNRELNLPSHTGKLGQTRNYFVSSEGFRKNPQLAPGHCAELTRESDYPVAR